MRIGIVGDVMLGDQPAKAGFGLYSKHETDYQWLIRRISHWMQSFDIVVGNLEGVLVDEIKEISPSKSAMKIPVQAMTLLESVGIRVLSIANNHTMEYGPASFHRMCHLLSRNGFVTVGHKARPYEIVETDTHKIGILGFSTIPGSYGYEPEHFYVDRRKEKNVRRLIAHLKEAQAKCDFLVVLPHWGYEFIEIPSRFQLEMAKKLTSSGADVVVGAHPHVIQKALIINRKPVVFSAGNLISDYWQERIRRSLLVEVNVETGQFLLHELHVDGSSTVRGRHRCRPFDTDAQCLEPNAESLGLVNRERDRGRREVGVHLLTNWREVVLFAKKTIHRGFPFYSPLGRTLQACTGSGHSNLNRAVGFLAEAMYRLYLLDSRRRGDLLVVLATT